MNPVKIYFSLIVCGLLWAVNPSYAQPATGNTKDALIKSGDEQIEKGQYYRALNNMRKHIKMQRKRYCR